MNHMTITSIGDSDWVTWSVTRSVTWSVIWSFQRSQKGKREEETERQLLMRYLVMKTTTTFKKRAQQLTSLSGELFWVSARSSPNPDHPTNNHQLSCNEHDLKCIPEENEVRPTVPPLFHGEDSLHRVYHPDGEREATPWKAFHLLDLHRKLFHLSSESTGRKQETISSYILENIKLKQRTW